MASTSVWDCKCRPGYYDSLAAADEISCLVCPVGSACPNPGATAATLSVETGWYRTSSFGVDLRPCPDGFREDSGCVGGVGNPGPCKPWLTGPYCRLCNVTGTTRYYDADLSECILCDENAAGKIAALVCGVLAVVLVILLFWRFRPDRKVRLLVKLSLRFQAVYTQISLRAKAKQCLGFYQIASRISEVYLLPFPKAAQDFLSIFEVFNVNIAGLSLPLQCVGLGSYWQQMLFTILFPIVIAAGITLSGIVYATFSKFPSKNLGNDLVSGLSVAMRDSLRDSLEDRHQSPLRVGVLLALPHLLTLTFLVFPTVSSTAFRAFSCEDFEGRSFLRADYAVECYTNEHYHALALAIAGIVIYPVGVSLLYIALFSTARSAIVHDKPTRLSRALVFLTADYQKSFFAWELVEAWRKLFLVGFCNLFLPGTVLQLLIAFVFSLIGMLATAVASPFASIMDNYIAKVCAFGLVATFFFAVVIKVNVLTEAVDDYLVGQLKDIFSFDIIVVTFGTLAALALALVATAAIAIQQLVSAVTSPVIKLRSTSGRPALPVGRFIVWHMFLSHIWSTGQDQCASIKRQLTLLLPGVSIFLDVDDLESIDELEDYIEKSQVIMLFVSKGYLKSKNCIREVRASVEKTKPLTLVHDPVRGGATLEFIKEQECPPELLSILDAPVIEYHRIKDFQVVSLKQIAVDLLLACPGYKEQYSTVKRQATGLSLSPMLHLRKKASFRKKPLTLLEDMYVPGEITGTALVFPSVVRLYASFNNPGAIKVAEVLREAMAGLELSRVPPPGATHFLLYLTRETFVGEDGERLGEEVRHMMRTNLPIVMLHENDQSAGGCEFAEFFTTTPQDLIHRGLYKELALAYCPGLFRPVSLTLVARKLGAEAKRTGTLRRLRSGLHLGHNTGASSEKGVVEGISGRKFTSFWSDRSSARSAANVGSQPLPQSRSESLSIAEAGERPLPKLKLYTSKEERYAAHRSSQKPSSASTSRPFGGSAKAKSPVADTTLAV
jgi:hypothetical protein